LRRDCTRFGFGFEMGWGPQMGWATKPRGAATRFSVAISVFFFYNFFAQPRAVSFCTLLTISFLFSPNVRSYCRLLWKTTQKPATDCVAFRRRRHVMKCEFHSWQLVMSYVSNGQTNNIQQKLPKGRMGRSHVLAIKKTTSNGLRENCQDIKT